MMTLYARQQKRHTDKRFWILWEKVEGGMIWENSTETYTLPNVKLIVSSGSLHETGHLGPVHWDHPEGWNGERDGRVL